jgi:hypothetical protein
MTPGKFRLSLYRGDTYRWKFTLWADTAKTAPADLTGATAAAQIRSTSNDGRVATLTCAIEAPNIVNAELTAAQSANLPPQGMRAQWDLQITWASGEISTVLAGNVDVAGDVTRAVA